MNKDKDKPSSGRAGTAEPRPVLLNREQWIARALAAAARHQRRDEDKPEP